MLVVDAMGAQMVEASHGPKDTAFQQSGQHKPHSYTEYSHHEKLKQPLKNK